MAGSDSYGSIVGVIPPVVSLDEAVALAGGSAKVVFADVRWWAGNLDSATGTSQTADELRQRAATGP